ncbi:MAG: hypothetical protein ACI93R_000016 [Flavobacteriales bacterium]|jgi:hypothetical protein
MSNLAILNNIDHKDLKIIETRSDQHQDNTMCVATFPSEFRALQSTYPIVFGLNSQSNAYTPLALLGLEKDENLFLKDGAWDARYVPVCAACKPFLIGPQSIEGDQQWVIHVDMDSPKLSFTDGTPLFKDQGGTSDFLLGISDKLKRVHEGIKDVEPMLEILKKFDLLEEFSAEISLSNGQKNRLTGFHTINEDKLLNLDSTAISALHESGYLADIYMQIASLSQISHLIERKNNC